MSELKSLDELYLIAEDFKQKMIEKMTKKHNEGYNSWNTLGKDILHKELARHIDKQIKKGGQEVDIAVFAMFLYFTNKVGEEVIGGN